MAVQGIDQVWAILGWREARQVFRHSYSTAIRRAVVRVNRTVEEAAAKDGRPKPPAIPHWHPHQLRHSVTAAAKRTAGLEGARAYLGHAMISTTTIYESRDLELAAEVARKIG